MATLAKDDTKPPKIIVRKMPVVIRKVVDNRLVRETNVHDLMYKEEIIYEGNGDFLKEKPSKIVLLNRFHRLKKISRTIVKCYKDDIVVEKTSDNLVNLIGQSNYDTVFTALCSVISQDLRIKGILALLTNFKDTKLNDKTKVGINTSCQTDFNFNEPKKISHVSTQTQKYYMLDRKQTRSRRKHFTPYIVKDTESAVSVIKKVIINPYQQENRTIKVIREPKQDSKRELDVFETESNLEPVLVNMPDVKREIDQYGTESEQTESNKEIQESSNMLCKVVHAEENSNESIGNISLFSVTTNNSIFDDLSIINKVDKHMQNVNDTGYILNIGDCIIKLRTKPEDNFHLATEENLEYLTPVEKKNLLLYQACIDFNNCLNRDEDGNMPFHIAVMNNDVELLKRHCAMLKIKKCSLDIPAAKDYTALKMAVLKDSPACANVLLRMGADPLQVDDNHRSLLHYAAEDSTGCMDALITYCRENARRILQENNDLWKANYFDESDENLAKVVLESVCSLCDDQGFTPLMLATQMGNYENAKLLVGACPEVVNKKMPTCGNTALYLTIAAACSDAIDHGNKTKLANKYLKTIELLLDNGADPSIENHSGGSVELLLVELNILDLSVLISKKLTSIRFYEGKTTGDSFESIMLVKNEDGDINIVDLNSDKTKEYIENKTGACPSSSKKKLRRHKNAANKEVDKERVLPVINSYQSLHMDNDNTGNDNVIDRNKEGSKIQILDNIPIKIESIQNLPTSSGYLVLNTINSENVKTSQIKRTDSKDVKVFNNSNIHTIDSSNMKIPISNATIIQKLNNVKILVSGENSVVQIDNTKTNSNLESDIVVIDNLNAKTPISNLTAIQNSNNVQISGLDKNTVINANDIKTHFERDFIVIDNLNMKIPISSVDTKSLVHIIDPKTNSNFKNDIIVTENLNMKIPILNSTDLSNTKKPLFKIVDRKTNFESIISVKKQTDSPQIIKTTAIENQKVNASIKPITDNQTSKFFDTFKNFIQNDIGNKEINERKRKHDILIKEHNKIKKK